MDMAFLRRAERLLAKSEPARLDHAMLVATLAAGRAAHAADAPPAAATGMESAGEEPLVELLTAGPGWRKAASAQQGCFCRAEAGRRVNDP